MVLSRSAQIYIPDTNYSASFLVYFDTFSYACLMNAEITLLVLSCHTQHSSVDTYSHHDHFLNTSDAIPFTFVSPLKCQCCQTWSHSCAMSYCFSYLHLVLYFIFIKVQTFVSIIICKRSSCQPWQQNENWWVTQHLDGRRLAGHYIKRGTDRWKEELMGCLTRRVLDGLLERDKLLLPAWPLLITPCCSVCLWTE